MNAVEFKATVHNGVITLPDSERSWEGKKITVILLDQNNVDVTTSDTIEPEIQDDFFSAAGIWEDRDIDQDTIRATAWPDRRG